jgi:hypothetical protein
MTFRRTRCPHCKAKLEAGQRIHVACIDGYADAQAEKLKRAEAKRERAAARVERAETRRRKAASKPRSKWLSECQAIVNRYVRLLALSRGEGCYTCGATPAQKFGGTYDAGHFRSVGSAPHLRYWIPQIRLQCIPCNRHKGGMALAFRAALVRDQGQEWVERLEAMQHMAKFDIPYLIRLKAVMGKKLRRLEKRCSAV